MFVFSYFQGKSLTNAIGLPRSYLEHNQLHFVDVSMTETTCAAYNHGHVTLPCHACGPTHGYVIIMLVLIFLKKAV